MTTALAVAALSLVAPALAQRPAAASDPAAAEARAADRALAAAIARSPHAIGHVLDVKLAEGSGAELVAGKLRSRTGHDLGSVQQLFDEAEVGPLFTALPWDELDRWHRRACDNLPAGRGPGHLGLWFRLTLPTSEAASALADQLWDLDLVEHVVHAARPTPACPPLAELAMPHDIPPPTPLFTALQQNHLPSPLGHGTWRAQGVLGARGQGIGFRMVESEWNFDHEDVHELEVANFIGPVPGSGSSEANHGTAGASMIVADRNEYGMTGMADEAEIRFVSQLTNGGVPNSLLAAGASAQPGDVVMLVMMYLLAQIGPQDWVPFEILQPVFDATLTLSGNGLIVVVSAGNGDNSLDDPRFFNRFDRGFRDSGAIFASSSMASVLDKAPFANYGSRIDANGWGDDVVACGIGTLFFPNNDRRQAYTADYTGTSSAVPAIAGIVTQIQGAAERQLGQRLTLAQIQQLLWTHGPMSPDAIGRRPDLWSILAAIGAVDGLEVGHPDVPIGASETVTISGPAGSGAFVFASFATGSLDLGFNREIHLALPTMITIGFLPLPAGTATFQVDVPNDAGLRGIDLYLQAGVLQGASAVHVTNSGQLTIV